MGWTSSKNELLALHEGLQSALRLLGERKIEHELLQSKFRNLELEWMNAHEKLKSISGRIAKRQALDDPEPEPAAATPTNSEQPPDPYAHLDPISARIQRRRDGGRA